ncbi:MAG: AI-2E family transporter [Lactobacillales bacterium]|jgi:predicted PurR-regulated permease PerM|nr:AI-2E family transporter [Lactobacillales bacterium]
MNKKYQSIKTFGIRILANRFNEGMISLALILLVIWLLSNVTFIFQPIGQFISLVVFPVVLTLIMYYLMAPIVDWLEKHRLPRALSISLIFLSLVGLVVLLSWTIFPTIEEQIKSLAKNFPTLIRDTNKEIEKLLDEPFMYQFHDQIMEQLSKVSKYAIDFGQKASRSALSSMSDIIDTIEKTFIGLVVTPFMLFYLLKDDAKVLPFVLSLLPVKWRSETTSVVSEINQKLSSYIRGQLLIAVFVTVVLAISFSICGLNYGITLAVLAGILNFLVPSFGSLIAMVPALCLALMQGPWMLVWVAVIFYVQQHLQSHLILPLVLGNQLEIHPLTVLIVLLWAGKVFGLVGMILSIPLYASTKVIVQHAYAWYRVNSGLYEESEPKN